MKRKDGYVELCSVAKVISGAPANLYNKQWQEGASSYQMLTGSSVSAENGIEVGELQTAWIRPYKDLTRYQLEMGDVVILARGTAIRPGLVSSEVEQLKPLASANFLIIRCDRDKLQPEYLMSYLTTSQGESALKSLANGSAIQSVSATSINSLYLPLPPLSVQAQIAELYRANKQAYAATVALADQQKKLANAKIAHMIWGVK